MNARIDEIDVSRRRMLVAMSAGVGAVGLTGCIGTAGDDAENPSADQAIADEFVLAASVRDDPEDVVRDWEPLAEWVAAVTDVPSRIDAVTDDSAAISALAAGQSHLAYLSGGSAWVGWQTQGLEVLVVEADAEGHTHYTAGAWVRADSDIETVADLEGVDSCHTGDLKGAGMLIPMAHLAHEGLVSFEEDDDITAIRDAVHEFFGEPLIGGGYIGALRCLSVGNGDVAFVRTSTPEDFCGGEEPEEWCLDLDEYRPLIGFADVPSHPMMVGPGVTDAEKDLLRDALLSLNDDPEGQRILEDVLAVDQLKPATAEEHLGPYGELIEILPGIEDHLLD